MRNNIFWINSILFILILIILTIAGFYSINKNRRTAEKDFSLGEADLVHHRKQYLLNSFLIIDSDLTILSELHELNQLINEDIDSSTEELKQDFLSSLKNRPTYDQLRFIDEDGKEIIRVNRVGDSSFLVPDEELQNKRSRYYINEINSLDPHSIYISQLDLNKEQGKVEIPYKPMIRVGTPLFNTTGIRKGSLIINILAEHILDGMELDTKSEYSREWILNKDSYWLYSHNKNDEFGFMFEGKENKNLQTQNPEAWKYISTNKTDQILLSDGLYTFDTLDFTSFFYKYIKSDRSVMSPQWKVVSFTPQSVLDAYIDDETKDRNLHLIGTLFLYLLVCLFIILISTWARKKKQNYDDQIRLKEQEYTDRLEGEIQIQLRDLTILKAALDHSGSSTIITDSTGNIEYVNQAFTETTGYSQEEVKGKNPRFLQSGLLSDDVYRNLWMTISSGGIWHGELINKNKDGSIVKEYASIAPVKDQDGAISHYISVKENISGIRKVEEELIASEKKHKTLFNLMNQGVLYLNKEGIIIDLNKSACKILGISGSVRSGHFEPINSFPISNYITEHNLISKDSLMDILANKQNVKNRLLCIKRDSEDSLDWISVDIIFQKDFLSDEVSMILMTLTDISEQKYMEKELIEARSRAESSAKAKMMFIANISHEIRTPMNSILGFINLVLDMDECRSEMRSYLKTAKHSARNLLSIINDILDISKFESGKMALEISRFDLKKLIDNTINSFRGSIDQKVVKLNWNYDSSLSETVESDKKRLRQVLVNLIGNAIKFTERGEINLSVEKNENNCLLFTITDTGIGMTQEQQNRIFKPFSQADESTGRHFGGTGLGTYISKSIIDLMKGEIWVESSLGTGSEFYFTIPYHSVESADDRDVNEYIDNIPYPHSTKSENMQILLAEDVEENITLAKINLERRGHIVFVAHSGSEAINLYKDESFDLILMDVQMPGMDGLEATQEIRKLERNYNKHTPIIAVTASVMKEERDNCFRAGMDLVIQKPIDFHRLFYLIEQINPDERFQIDETIEEIESVEEMPILSANQGINWDKAISVWNDEELYKKVLLDFAEKYAHYPDLMAEMMDKDDLTQLKKLAHKLKGVAATLYLPSVSEHSTAINIFDSSKDKTEDLQKNLTKLKASVTEVLSSIGQMEKAVTDRIEIKKWLEEFRKRLEKGEIEKQQLAEMEDQIGRIYSPDIIEKIKTYIDDYDFNKAIPLIKRMESDLE